MPADKKKAGSGKGSPDDKDTSAKPLKLHATAKAFVPSAATLQATATVWQPGSTPTKAASSPKAAASKAPPAKNGAKDSGKPATSAAAAAKPSAAEAVKQAPPAKATPVAKAPAVAAWGTKSSAAVKQAAPIRQNQRPAAQKQNQQQQGRGGQGKRGDQKSGNNRQQGGNNSGGSWARAASKPGSDKGPERGSERQSKDGGNRRQHQNRGENHGDDRGSNRGDNNRRDQDRGDNNNNSNWSRGKVLPVALLEAGEGSTDAEKAVKRINVDDLLDMRLKFLDPPSKWETEEGTKPAPACLWDSPTRISEIEEASKAPRIGGDVSRDKKKAPKKNPHDTAPALEDCVPLEVNNETRWKAKVMDGKENKADEDEVDSKEEILRKATVFLNKLTLTKFDKLSDEFINCGIGRDVETLSGALGLIVQYAQEQQHFSSMYAGLCLKLANTPMEGIDEGSKKGKKFKKMLLQRCQDEFETDTATKIKEATKDITEKEVIEYHANLIKKHYLGHMRFIGELYKGDLISIKIMLFCLPALLKGEDDDESSNDVDEEKVECFSKLMTVIGSSLEQQSEAMRSVGKADAAESLAECWRIVEIMAGKRQEEGPKVSNRMKFMLQDLLEMKAKGWIKRREEETAKTIAQIHNEVAKEERAAARRDPRRSQSSASLRGKGSIRRGASSGDVRNADKQQTKPQVDKDGFVSVAPSSTKGFNRSASMSMMGMRTQSKDGLPKSSAPGGRRPSSGKFAALNESGSKKSSKKESSGKAPPAKEEKPKANYPTPDECGDKAKNIMKEYFIGGDTDDAVLSIHELVGAGSDGSIDRGAKVVEAAVLLVLEMKASDIEKFLNVYLRCAKEKKIVSQSFVTGLNDPLEFLIDVAIDAPLAIPHLASIVAGLVKAETIPFGFLLDSPEYFRTDQNAADFGAKVLKKIGGDATSSQDHLDVIDKLMTCEDKAKHSSAADLIAEA